MSSADLIIGHAGAGTCMEALKLGKPLIVVVNETLMDNHQIELAERLTEGGFVLYCTPTTLKDILKGDKFFHLRSASEMEFGDFGEFLDKRVFSC